MNCGNCDEKLESSYSFCPNCGQNTHQNRLNFEQLLTDLWKAFADTDQGILITVKQLVYRPGFLARDYINGKRKTYFNPFKYLVLMLAIALFFILKLVPFMVDFTDNELANNQVLQFAFRNLNTFILLMCPLYAVLMRLFFWDRKTNFVEILAFSAFLNGQIMLFYMLCLIFIVVVPGLAALMMILFGLGICIWFIVAVSQFYGTFTLGSVLKTVLIMILAQTVIAQVIIHLSFLVLK